MSIISKSTIKPGLRVRVEAAATYHVRKAAEKLGAKSLVGTALTGVDPCCGCVIVEFDKPIGTDEVYYTSGKLGYVDEVEPRFMSSTSSKAKAPGLTIKKGDTVKVVTEYDAAKVGMVGTVVTTPSAHTSRSYGVKFASLSSMKGGHSLGGILVGDERYKGQWVPGSHLIKVTADVKEKDESTGTSDTEYFLKKVTDGQVKVNFVPKRKMALNSGREVIASSFYGWLMTSQEGSMRRQVIVAPFGEDEWMTITPKDCERVWSY